MIRCNNCLKAIRLKQVNEEVINCPMLYSGAIIKGFLKAGFDKKMIKDYLNKKLEVIKNE